ncbi:MAG TPA: TonB-dependent receptor, partial [Niastella sp.]|nr:TonB-dependent receptor [Niastella sp.]
IRYSNTTTIESVSYLPKLQNEFGGFGGEALGAPGTVLFPENPFVPYVSYENQSYGPRYNGQQVPIGMPVRIFNADGTFVDSVKMGTYSAKPDAKRNFFNKGVTVQNDVSYSTGDEKSRFYLSAQDVNTTGIVPKDKNHRNAFRLSGTRESGRFSADYSLGYTLTHTNTTPGTGVPSVSGPFAGSNLFGGSTGGSYFQGRPVYWTVINTPAHIDLRDYKDWKNDPFANPNGYFNAYYGNPWWQIDQSRLDERNSDLLGNLTLNLKATDWLNFTARGSVLRTDYNAKYTRAGFTFADWAIEDQFGAGSIPSSVQKLDPQEGDASSSVTRLTGDFLASITKRFSDFSVKVIGGSEVVDNLNNNYFLSSTSLVIPDFYSIRNRNGEPNVDQSTFHTRTVGVFGDATLGFRDFLFLHGSVRNDWVSILSKENRSFLYPAVDASFSFTDAFPGLKSGFISSGKLRAAYSKTAQVSIGPYSLENTFVPGNGFPFTVPGFQLSSDYANPDIKPEFTTEREIGLEMTFLKNRAYFGAAYFHSNTNNQTIPITVSSTTGFTRAFVNSGEMSNKGVELDLQFTPLLETKGGLRWDIRANFSYIKNELLSIQEGLNEVQIFGNSFAVVGKAYPQLKVTDWKRDSATGMVIVNPINGLPTPDPTPKTYGTTNPPIKLGLSSSLSFKGLTLSAVGDYRTGAYIYNDIGQDLDFTGVSWNSARFGRQNFVYPNSVVLVDGKYVQNTNVTVRNGNNEFWASTMPTVEAPYVTSAAFWKIREVSLTYDLPRNWLSGQNVVKTINIGLVARNLFMFRPKENIWTDPEFSTTNGNGIGTTDINQTPTTRTYGASVSVSF